MTSKKQDTKRTAHHDPNRAVKHSPKNTLEHTHARLNHAPNPTIANSANSYACPVAQQCGACQLLDVPYDKQLSQKQASIVELFEDIATSHTICYPVLGMAEPFYYRNKVTSPYAPGKKRRGATTNHSQKQHSQSKQSKKQQTRKQRHPSLPYEVRCGMYAAHSHRIIPTDECLLENKTAKAIILAIRDLMERFGIEAYREDSGTGFIRHAIVRVGHTSGEVLVTLVTNGRDFPGAKKFVQELVKRCPAITSIVQNINTRQTNVILGEKEQRLYGPGFILDKLCGLSFRISSHSFYQVNSEQTEVLYRRAIEMANLSGTETVMDAYCGTGTIGLVAAHGLDGSLGAKRVIGVDNVESAIADAKNNARHNGIENADFVVADAGEFMTSLADDEGGIDVLLMDPPRAGSSEAFLHAACTLAPETIVYISCNPKTQQRDAIYLCNHGYKLAEIQAVDMFPHTDHIENICRFVRA